MFYEIDYYEQSILLLLLLLLLPLLLLLLLLLGSANQIDFRRRTWHSVNYLRKWKKRKLN